MPDRRFVWLDTFDGARRRFGRAGMLAVMAWLAGCTATPQPAKVDADPPPAPREFRGAWVASVANIDWPSRKGLPVSEQKAEIVRIVEAAHALNLNALIVQVRPSADALYVSSIEPWSEYLTGQEGRAPDPPYDPLRMWIDEAHRRGIAIHAWFNPYRARHSSAAGANSPAHISATNPGIVKRYGENLWMDPGESAAAARTLAVIVDVVRRYDIDGVHIDDYFYPYPVRAPGGSPAELEFPDDPSWLRCVFRPECAALSREQWRRRNVDTLVEAIHGAVHREKPWVRVGISPFGIGRPDRRPPGITGFSQFDKLHADVELWLGRGWLDYLAPQLYWRRDDREHAFSTLFEYWMSQNPHGRHIWPGLFTTRAVGPDSAWPLEEIVEQIELTRTRSIAPAQAAGHVHFSMRPLATNTQGIRARLSASTYRAPALVPAARWLGATPLAAPVIAISGVDRSGGPGTGAERTLTIAIVNDRTNDPATDVRQYAAWVRAGGRWHFAASAIIGDRTGGDRDATAGGGAATPRIAFAALAGRAPEVVVAFALDRYGNAGPVTRWRAADAP